MRDSLSRIFALTKRNLKEIVRDPLSLIFMLALPLFMEILFYFLFHELTAQFEMKFLAPGIVVFSQAFLSLFTGLLIALDKSSSYLTRLYVSKARPFEFIFSYAFSILPITAVQSVLFFLVGGLFDTSLFSWGMLYAFLIGFVPSLFFIAVGILLGSVCNEKSVGGVASIVIMGQSVLSGMWFPIEGLGGGMITFMKVLPFKNMTMLVMNAFNGVTDLFSDFLLPLIIVSGCTIVAFAAAILAFKNNMKAR